MSEKRLQEIDAQMAALAGSNELAYWSRGYVAELVTEVLRLREQHHRMLDYFDVEDGEAVESFGVDPR